MMGLADSLRGRNPRKRPGGWRIFWPGKPLKDRKLGKLLAYEAFFVGNAQLTRPGTPASMTITVAKEEVARGDRLITCTSQQKSDALPPDALLPATGAHYFRSGGLTEGGLQFPSFSVNRGSRDGVKLAMSGTVPQSCIP